MREEGAPRAKVARALATRHNRAIARRQTLDAATSFTAEEHALKTITRIVTAAIAAVVSVFIAAPAFAASEDGIGAVQLFHTTDHPIQVGAILAVGAILLVIVIASSVALGSLFDQKRKRQ